MKPVVLKGDAAVGYSIFVLCEDDDDGVLGRGDVSLSVWWMTEQLRPAVTSVPDISDGLIYAEQRLFSCW